MHARPDIAVSADSPAGYSRARTLAQDLRLPLVDAEQAQAFDLLLVVTGERLELQDLSNPRVRPLAVDFSGLDVRRHSPALSRRQPLSRAVGAKAQTVVDATAGLGQDAFLLAAMGYRVTAIERCGPVAALLADGLARAQADPRLAGAIDSRLVLIEGEARVLLPALPPPDVVYLDPMFPQKRKKSAAVRKEMRLLRQLAGEDEDAVALFDVARVIAQQRVVVKRPDDAPPLVPDPTVSYGGKLIRYDVYRTERRTHV